MDKWYIVGFTGQFIFACRFIVQWICSEIKKKSHVPIVFWYLSLLGGVIMLIYSISRRDPVFIVGQASGLIVYSRNLIIIKKSKMETA